MDFGAVLSYESLTGVVEKFKFGSHKFQRLFPGRPIDGSVETWDVIDPSRAVGAYTSGAALEVGKDAVSNETEKVFRQFYRSRFQGTDLTSLRRLGSNAQDRVGRSIRNQQLLKMTRRVAMTNEYLRALALRDGISVTVDGITKTVTFGVASEHKPNVSITNPWSTTSNDISTDVLGWADLIGQDSGYEATTIHAGWKVFDYVMRNDKVVATLGGSAMAEQIIKQGYAQDIFGFNWVRYTLGYKPDGGSFTPFIPDNRIIMTPEPDGAWSHEAEGIEHVPTADGNDIQTATGLFSYGDVEKNPVAVVMYVGDNRIPILDIPNAIIYAQVAPDS
jgi:hypothetical protein